MTIDRAKRLAEQWSKGRVCSLREGEAEEYHKLCLDALRAQKQQCGLTNEQLGRVIKNSYIEGYEDCKAGKPPLEKRNNAPLTMDELLEMVGDPVWTVGVSYTKDGTFSMWDIIESVDENGIQFGYSSEHPEWWNYGLKTPDGKLCGWLAYRRKPEEEKL